MSNAWGHFRTITRHRHQVIAHCFKAGIFWQGLLHDLSKYSPAEFLPGAKYYTGKRSPNDGEREDRGYSLAWMHHKGRNRHHYEFWTDYDPVTRKICPVAMPVRYVIEMFCDRVAASKIYNVGNYTDDMPLKYFLKGQAPFNMHPDTRAMIEGLLTMLKNEGEAATFRHIRKDLRIKA